MKYVKLRLFSADRELLYERDFAVEALGPFVTLAVSDLAGRGTLREGEYFVAELTPRYRPARPGEPLLLAGTCAAPAPETSWLSLRLDEPPRPDEPVQSMTLDLHLVERRMTCRSEHPASEPAASLVGPELESALTDLKLLRAGEHLGAELLVLDDDRADLTRERLPTLERRSAQLVEMLPETEPAPRRAPPTFANALPVGRLADDDVRIYIDRAELARLHGEGRQSTAVERGGVLVGEVYQDERGRHVVEICGSIIHEDREASAVAFRYTSRSWQEGAARLRERFPDKRIVGWYHTHLVVAVNPDALELTTMFFSRDDVFVHRNFFPDPWYVALVLDPWGKCQFFQWKGGEVVACGGYHVYDGTGG